MQTVTIDSWVGAASIMMIISWHDSRHDAYGAEAFEAPEATGDVPKL